MKIVLLYGGRSTEHEVSLVSASGILRELACLPGYDPVPVGIRRDGVWFLQDYPTQLERANRGEALTIDPDRDRVVVLPGNGFACSSDPGTPIVTDCVFPILHGSYGEDGTVQGLLEIASLPYVGSGIVGSSVGMDKVRSKQLWEQRKLPVVPYFTVRQDPSTPLTAVVSAARQQIEARFGFPVFVKPNAAGSSVGVSRVSDATSLTTAIRRSLAVDPVVLIEQAIPAREIETAVLGNQTVRSFPPGEVIPTHEFYDYEAKYEDPDGARLAIPADISPAMSEEIQRVCREAFVAVDGSGLARVDSFLDRKTGAIYLNEINMIPGFTPISMYPKMVEAGGIPYGQLLKELITLGIERFAALGAREFDAR